MMTQEIVVGDTVRLKSGGPTMEVEAIDHGRVDVVYRTKNGKVKDVFPVGMLRRNRPLDEEINVY